MNSERTTSLSLFDQEELVTQPAQAAVEPVPSAALPPAPPGLLSIEANGSKWAGDDPDPIEMLIDRLSTLELDSHFAYYSRDAHGVTSFNGNFANVSAVYRVSVTTGSPLDLLLTRLHVGNAGWARA